MPLPAARARNPEDAVKLLNELLDYMASGIGNSNVSATEKVTADKLKVEVLGPLTITTAGRKIPHSLGVKPSFVTVTERGTGLAALSVWEFKPADAQAVYLDASSQVTVTIRVEA